MKIAAVVAVVLVTCGVAGADVTDAQPGDLMGFEIGLIDPFAEGAPSYGALMLPIKALPIDPPASITSENWYRTIPQHILANTAVEIIAPFTFDDIDLGVSAQVVSIRGNLPIRIGMNHTDAGWGWHVTGAVWTF